MSTHAEIETRLRLAYQVAPTEDGLRFLDQSVGRLMGQGAIAPPHRRTTVAVLLRPFAFVAVFVLLATGVGAALGLLDRTVESSALPGWRVAWDRAQVLDLQQTDSGVTISLNRAYADLNQVLVGFTVEGLSAPPMAGTDRPAPVEWVAQLTDPSGRPSEDWAVSKLAMAGDETGLSAIVQTWQGTPSAEGGTWELAVSSVGYASGTFAPGACTAGSTDPACASPAASAMVEGSWLFRFDLPAAAGTIVAPNVSQTAAGATITLTELRITPTEITSRIGLKVDGVTVTGWAAPGYRVSNADGSIAYVLNTADRLTLDPAQQGAAGAESRFIAIAGSDNPSDTWVVEIPELRYWTAGGGEVAGTLLSGPWKLTVTVP